MRRKIHSIVTNYLATFRGIPTDSIGGAPRTLRLGNSLPEGRQLELKEGA
jgi:hypothetical protein